MGTPTSQGTVPKRKAVNAADLPPSIRSRRLKDKMGCVEETKRKGRPTYPRASLLGLPAELLNRIYRDVLVEDFKIAIIETNKPQYPGLVAVCRKTYMESRLIFLEENTFSVYCYDLKNPLPRQPTSHWICHPTATRFGVYEGSLNWRNLMEWVKLWHEGKAMRAPKPSLLSGGRLMPKLASGSFSTVEAMGKVEWSTMERVLEGVRMALEDVGVAFGYM
ncbi:uncharacterized protein MYCFIDRAFT_197978 [Pseudocercospora fijiensis CIRAD86]|uniref:F-box domain-containing protein n=1 Tax=Pseudocercospora fijiensis (strain CIRAD86) TaxID=383855 RepID=M2YTX3_PSEFD|nr:uncharacterized protein MYCFIDRAFT_197978 [Pseudocercospora fijiensis CIRAD86]EME81185.1 hypothetical protein MYCFIDRAFT_197978 [Pseudocercospora fijiensis CIRAD86]